MCVAELLHINDQLNNVALRYERFERMHAGGAAVSQPDAPPSTESSAPALESSPYPVGVITLLLPTALVRGNAIASIRLSVCLSVHPFVAL